MSSMIAPPQKVFISYSQRNTESKEEIERWLSSTLNLTVLSDTLIYSNSPDWQNQLHDLWAESNIFILLISNHYLQSSTISSGELPEISNRVKAGTAYIIPIILEKCDWTDNDLVKYKTFSFVGNSTNDPIAKEDVYGEIEEYILRLQELIQNRNATERLRMVRETQQESLDLADCDLTIIPPDILEFPWLTKMELQKNGIRKIENLATLTKLTYLDLSDNGIGTIENLETLTKLEYLDLERNKLLQISKLEKNTQLKLLGLSTNYIEKLTGISHLKKLETLYLGRNKLKDVSSLAKLPNIKRIILTDNSITSLEPIKELINRDLTVYIKYALKLDEPGIFVKGNPIAEPPIDIIPLGKQAILDHFNKGNLHGYKKLEIMKLILVGNSGVGKTNLSQFLRNQTVQKEHISTQVLDIQSWYPDFLKSADGEPMLVNIFDFGGQDYYHDSHRLYYSHDTAYVLLWDSKSNKYEEKEEPLTDTTKLVYENYPIEYWLESIQYNLYGKETVDYTSGLKGSQPVLGQASTSDKKAIPAKVEPLQAKHPDLAKSAPVLVLQNKIEPPNIEATLNQTSLKEKYPNISHFFNISITSKKRTSLLNDVLDDCIGKLNLAGRTLVTYQHEIIEAYLKSDMPFEALTISQFRDKCQSLTKSKIVLDIADAQTIASVLTNLGIVYFLPGSEGNSEQGIVFTQIRLLNEQIKDLMNIAKLGDKKGLFTYDDVSKLDNVEKLLSLLQKNRSIVTLGPNQYLVPHFLPVDADESIQHFIQAFVHCNIRFVYKAYFHKSLLMSLFADFLKQKTENQDETTQVKGVYYWRNGLILSKKSKEQNQMVFVNFVKEETTCRIEIRTMYPFQKTGLERELEKRLEELNEGWSCIKEVSSDSVQYFPVATLLQNAEKGIFTFKEENLRYSINDFKDLVSFPKLPKKLFISYSSKNSEFIRRFETHLAVLKAAKHIEPWYDRMIEPGSKWDDTIRTEMEKSDIVIFLISPDFLATSYIMDIEVKKALDMEVKGICEIFPIELQPCSWNETDLNRYQMQLNPTEAGKKEYFVGKPDNDESWKTIIAQLKLKLKI